MSVNELPSWAEQEATLNSAVHGHVEATDGGELHYWVVGAASSAPRVVLIEGMSSTHFGWLPFACILARRGWQSMLVDNRGMGQSLGVTVAGLTINTMARDLLTILRHSGWTEASDSRKIHVAGVSMGGMIATELVAIAPELFASVSFVSTRAGGNLWTRMPSWGTCYAMLRSPFVQGGDGRREAENSARMVFGEAFMREHYDVAIDLLLHSRRVAGMPAVATTNAQAKACMQHDGFGLLARIRDARVPAQVLTGTNDPMIDAGFSSAMAAELRCPLHQAQNAGHMLLIERTEWFCEKMFSFIETSETMKHPETVSTSTATLAPPVLALHVTTAQS